MIQRIQSVFLFLSLCFFVPMFFVPVAELVYFSGEILKFDLTGFYITDLGTTTRISSQTSIKLFAILISALTFVTIFLYKNRLLQMRLCIYNVVLLLGIAGVALLVLNNVQDIKSVSYRLPIVFPVVCSILHYLAFRAIRRDHFMVEALSRLR